jgi:hypothetical protein
MLSSSVLAFIQEGDCRVVRLTFFRVGKLIGKR